MNWETVVGLGIVALNAGVAAVLGEQGLQLDPLAHAILVAISAASGAILLYIRPAMRGGDLIDPPAQAPVVAVTPTEAPVTVVASAPVAPKARSEYPN